MSRLDREEARLSPWRDLARPDAFAGDPSAADGVEWIQTHLSHVYRTGARVYKFRKPVDLGFVCFTSLAERNADCLREVALNRRLAPDVYLGVAPLEGSTTRPRVGSPAERLSSESSEHCVVMRRLPAGRDALSLLEAGALGARHIDALARRISRFHLEHALGAPAPFSREEWLARCTRPVAENWSVFAAEPDLAPADVLAAAQQRAAAFAADRADRFERRRIDGRAVDAHGDLHLQHVWFEDDDGEPIAIDGLEFSESLRRIDAASEVAFFAMDLRYRNDAGLAERFLRSYARESDDYDLYSVVDYFVAYRAGVRAKVAALAARDGAIAPAQRALAAGSARRHLALAADPLPARAPRPALVLVSGVVGTGKSTVAAGLADLLDAVVIASDRVRKRLLGVAPATRLGAGWQRGAYTPEQTQRTYAGVLERARPVLASGRTAILDAAFARRSQREAAARLGGELGAEVLLVVVGCDEAVARERLARRAAAGTDPSDAGPEHYAASVRNVEPAADWPAARRADIRTDRDGWRGSLPSLAEWIRSAAH